MTQALRHTVGWLVPMMLIGLPSRTTLASCADELRIDASPTESRKLRERLTTSGKLEDAPLENCRSSRIHLQPANGGWLVEFYQGNAKVTRKVQSIPVAAMWIESWLVPPPKSERRQAAVAATSGEREASANRPIAGAGSTAAAMTASMAPAVESSSVLSVAPEGSLWMGPQLRGHAGLSGALWIEPHVAIAWPINNKPDDMARSFRLGANVGRAVYDNERLTVSPYVDASVVTLLWRDEKRGKDLAGPALGVGLAITVRLYSSLRLVARAEGSASFLDGTEYQQVRHWDGDGVAPSDRSEQRFEPRFSGVFGVGIQIAFGGGN